VRAGNWGVGRGTYLLIMQSNSPTNHIRMVKAGISGSSMLDTDARTSGNGLSSSSIASKSNSILLMEGAREGEGQQVSEGCGDDMSERGGKAREQEQESQMYNKQRCAMPVDVFGRPVDPLGHA
jgi:hypothetical protein